MKYKKIATICKNSKCINLIKFPEKYEQWIGTTSAIYDANSLPYLTKQQIFTMFDVSEKAQENYIFIEDMDLGELLSDTFYGEYEVIPMEVKIEYNQSTFIPFETNDGIIFINECYFSPFQEDNLKFFIRGDKLAVKFGLFLLEIIGPSQIIDKNFVGDILNISSLATSEFKRMQSTAQEE